jgi:hypothetical protein
MYLHNEICSKMLKTCKSFRLANFDFIFGLESFFVSPARHGEAQDMSGT